MPAPTSATPAELQQQLTRVLAVTRRAWNLAPPAPCTAAVRPRRRIEYDLQFAW